MNSRKKLWFSSFLLNFKNLISRFDFQNVYVKNPIGPIFQIFGPKKNANNKTFRKNLCIYKKQIRKQKNYDSPLLTYGTRCGIIFHISTIIFGNANTTYSNEHNLIVFWRVFWKYFFGIPDTKNTPAWVQKCFWNDKNTRKWVSGHNTQCQNNQCHNTQCDILW